MLECNHCSKVIDGKGEIDQGLAYHQDCLAELKADRTHEDWQAFVEQYSGINEGVLDNLWDEYGREDRLGELKVSLESRWCAIISVDGEVLLATNTNKAELLKGISKDMDVALVEGSIYTVVALLNNGRAFNGTYGVKIVLKPR